jgi:UDP-N-acetylmuramoylalanine--D-glutamate ligase
MTQANTRTSSDRGFAVQGHNVTVVGAARSGVAAALLLADRGARVTLTDVRPALDAADVKAQLDAAGVTLELGEHRLVTFTGADLIVLSPGVPLDQPQVVSARQAGVPVIGEIELASRWLNGRIVAITGTKGKSTTTTLAGRMFDAGGLKATVGGNVGVPLSSQVATSTPETFHIVEVSSFQLETTVSFHPWIAVLLNFSPDHLDRHHSVEEYAEAKMKIFFNQTQEDWAVINADDPQTLQMARDIRARRFDFSSERPVKEGIVIRKGHITESRPGGEVPLIPLSSIRLIGKHLVADVMAAAAVARIAGVSAEAMIRAVESFTGLEHALEPLTTIGGVRFVNDSKATNIDAAKHAIESFATGLVVILGGVFKGGDWNELAAPLRARRAKVIAIGEAQPLIRRALGDVVPVYPAPDLPAAVRQAFTLAAPGGTVLLAPACASFDMFRDYAERGHAFKREVKKLAEESRGMRRPM